MSIFSTFFCENYKNIFRNSKIMASRKRKGSENSAAQVCDLTCDDAPDESKDDTSLPVTTKNTRRRKALSKINNEAVFWFSFSEVDRIGFTTTDVDSLNEGSFLNDTIVDFYCHWIEGRLSFEMKERVHLFSSFLYAKLLSESKNAQDDGIAKWTKDVDIFKKDFLFFPVCEKLHWLVSVICLVASPIELTPFFSPGPSLSYAFHHVHV